LASFSFASLSSVGSASRRARPTNLNTILTQAPLPTTARWKCKNTQVISLSTKPTVWTSKPREILTSSAVNEGRNMQISTSTENAAGVANVRDMIRLLSARIRSPSYRVDSFVCDLIQRCVGRNGMILSDPCCVSCFFFVPPVSEATLLFVPVCLCLSLNS